MDRPAILKTCVFRIQDAEDRLKQHFEVHDLPEDEAAQAALLDRIGPRIRGIATASKGPVTEAMLDKLPALEIVSSWSAGREGIAVDAIRRRNLKFFDTAALLADDVADLAMALMLASLRNLLAADRYVRDGKWAAARMGFANRVGGKRLGILGLGEVGRAVAHRATAFGMEIAYAGPHEKPDVPYRYVPTPLALADWSEVLVVCAAGGNATRHIVDATVLDALGPEGWLINVARGSIVDQAALIAALAEGRIRGAGLDVLETEPEVPPELIASSRVVLTPHCGSSTHETKTLQASAVVDRLLEHFHLAPAPAHRQR